MIYIGNEKMIEIVQHSCFLLGVHVPVAAGNWEPCPRQPSSYVDVVEFDDGLPFMLWRCSMDDVVTEQ